MTPEEAGNLAVYYRRQGRNCAESVLLAFCDYSGVEPSPYIRMVSGFVSGIGGAGCACGSLAAAIGCAGLSSGRDTAGEDKKYLYDLCRRIHDRFEAQFQSTCCRVLSKRRTDKEAQHLYCDGLACSAAAILIEELTRESVADPPPSTC